MSRVWIQWWFIIPNFIDKDFLSRINSLNSLKLHKGGNNYKRNFPLGKKLLKPSARREEIRDKKGKRKASPLCAASLCTWRIKRRWAQGQKFDLERTHTWTSTPKKEAKKKSEPSQILFSLGAHIKCRSLQSFLSYGQNPTKFRRAASFLEATQSFPKKCEDLRTWTKDERWSSWFWRT